MFCGCSKNKTNSSKENTEPPFAFALEKMKELKLLYIKKQAKAKDKDKSDYDLAIKALNYALVLDPQFAFAYNIKGVSKLKKGDLNGAIAEYTKAIKLNPKHKYAYKNRGNLYFYKTEFQKAMKDYQINLENHPKDKYSAIWLYLIKTRIGENGISNLKSFYEKMNGKDKWITPVIQMFLNEITPEKCLELSKHMDQITDKEQKCEVYFYIGQFYLIKGNNEKAKEYFKKCLKAGVKHFTEYIDAKFELNEFNRQ